MKARFALVLCSALWTESIAAQSQLSYQGTVIGKNGIVEHNKSQVPSWSAVAVRQPLSLGEQLRTEANAETAVLLMRSRQLKLDERALLTLADTPCLVHGKAWVRVQDSEHPLKLKGSSACRNAVRSMGTEFVMESRPGDVTVVTVLHGSVELSNDVDTAEVRSGFEGTAVPGVPIAVTRSVLTPEDAVQWILYYPIVFPRHDLLQMVPEGSVRNAFERMTPDTPDPFSGLDAQDVWVRVGRSMWQLGRGDVAQATSVLGAAVGRPEAEAHRLAQLAAVNLYAGRAAVADSLLRSALAIDPRSLRALTLLAKTELTRNRKAEAKELANAAVAAHPRSVEAHVVAGEIAQAHFDLDDARRHFDAALAVDPNDVHALVNRARVRFGSDDVKGAERDAALAASLAPSAPEVKSLEGFILLARGDLAGARASFEAALERDPNFAEPHIGLGLVAFETGSRDEGLQAMLAATLLEPRVALYQSYLGKAYHQIGKHKQALAALEVAKGMDTLDPTPWLYSAVILRDLHRSGEALGDLRQAILLNDNRAVYRSRLLLDRDLATKNVSLARIFAQFGFAAWGAHEALKSQAAEPTNSGAHLFLAETFGELPDRLQAFTSEFLQFKLHAPVNQNALSTYNEYTALFEQSRTRYETTLEGGEKDRWMTDQVVQGGNDRIAYFGLISVEGEQGARPTTADQRVQGSVELNIAAGRNTNLIASFTSSDNKRGFDEDASVVVGEATTRPIVIRRISLDQDPNDTFRDEAKETGIGIRHSFSPRTTFVAAAMANWITSRQSTPDFFVDFDPDPSADDIHRGTQNYEAPWVFYDVELQTSHRRGVHTFIVGVGGYHTRRRTTNSFDLRSDNDGSPFVIAFDDTVTDRGISAWIRHEASLKRLHTVIGLQAKDDEGHDVSGDSTLTFQRIDPFVGFSLTLTPATIFRVAAFRTLNSSFVSSSVAPTSVVGFVTERNEFPYVTRKEADVSIEHAGGRQFHMLQGFTRRTEVPAATFVPSRSEALGLIYHFNLLIDRRWGLSASNSLVRDETSRYTSLDDAISASLTLAHESGLTTRLSNTYVLQRFSETDIPELVDTEYNLTDLEMAYEFRSKRVKAKLTIRNLFDERFTAFLEGLTLQRPRPQRHSAFTIDFRF